MNKMNLQSFVVLVSLILVQPIVSPGSYAVAKKRSPPRAYSFIAEGGKASQAECDGVRKLPRLKKLKEFSKVGSYMGSEHTVPEVNRKADQEMWVHFFRDKGTCASILAKTPSALEDKIAKDTKREIPSEDSVETDDSETEANGEGEQTERPQADQPDAD